MDVIKTLFKLLKSFFYSYMNRKAKTKNNNQKKPTALLDTCNLIKLNRGRIRTVNIIGFRDESNPGTWNDLILVNVGNKLILCEATTDPSRFYTENPLHPSGAAHLPLDYYEDLWILGLHSGKYDALVQRGKKIRVWRDKNKNFKDDDKGTFYKTSGINLHHGNNKKYRIGVQSGGCQVIQLKDVFFDIYENIKSTGQKSFDYLLMLIEDCPDIIKKLKKHRWYYL